jgi:hypothetical protein
LADFVLWTVVFWMPNPDGSNTENLALVVPATNVGTIPYGGSLPAIYDGEIESDQPEEILEPETLEIQQAGLYKLEVSATIKIQKPGVSATLNLQVTFGERWADGFEGTPLSATYAEPPVPGETITVLSGGRQLPKIAIQYNNDFTLTAGSGNDTLPVSGSLGDWDITFQEYGYETVWFSGYFYLQPGDELSLQLVATDSPSDTEEEDLIPIVLNVNGALTWLKLTSNPFGSFGIYY